MRNVRLGVRRGTPRSPVRQVCDGHLSLSRYAPRMSLTRRNANKATPTSDAEDRSLDGIDVDWEDKEEPGSETVRPPEAAIAEGRDRQDHGVRPLARARPSHPNRRRLSRSNGEQRTFYLYRD